MNLFQIKGPIDTIAPETVFLIGDFPIANSTLAIVLVAVLIALACFFIIRKFKINPNKIQICFEIIYEGIEAILSQITGKKFRSQILFSFIATLFIFIALANLITFIPGISSFTFNGVFVFRSPTADFNTTFALALGAILLIQFVSIKEWGFFGHIAKFFKFKEVYKGFKQGISEGMISLVDFFIGLLDIIGEIAKVISLSLRLFGNIYAGMVLTTVIFGALAYFLPVIWLGFGLLFGIVQAVVFSSLVAAYYMMAINPSRKESD